MTATEYKKGRALSREEEIFWQGVLRYVRDNSGKVPDAEILKTLAVNRKEFEKK